MYRIQLGLYSVVRHLLANNRGYSRGLQCVGSVHTFAVSSRFWGLPQIHLIKFPQEGSHSEKCHWTELTPSRRVACVFCFLTDFNRKDACLWCAVMMSYGGLERRFIMISEGTPAFLGTAGNCQYKLLKKRTTPLRGSLMTTAVHVFYVPSVHIAALRQTWSIVFYGWPLILLSAM